MLKIENLTLEKDGRQILNGINLSVNKGEIYALLGRNGTGKTSLAYAVMGCKGYEAGEGKIIFERNEITRLSISQRAKLGITLAWQKPAVFEGLTVEEYLKCKNNDTNVHGLLSIVGMSSIYLNRMVDDKLSGGERKRIELASVMAMKPKLAILDEIDSGIDAPSLPFIRKTVQKMRDNGITIILISHSEDTLNICDRASLIGAGQVLKTAYPKIVKEFFTKHCKQCNHLYEIDWKEIKYDF
ncbi:MAG: hypothetical protein B1H08_03805 [Candidatus Omnitrophica bacterium 4484_171]|nr:MAG: hypothetical protein B1H08_03805 [Candidatus Omnitrophica bacterium 4484_171]